jgi:hypothetical protein
VAHGLPDSHFLLNTSLQQFGFCQFQTQIGDSAEIIGPDQFHDIRAPHFTIDARFDKPQNPPHPSPQSGEKRQINTPDTLRF